ncbi:hypothetical protein Eta_0041 [Serratia phage Eta]|uniref:Uncharacterized protein n=1 Tax=Serratia phage Eta TaxID=1282995 RepID=R9W097_9CAUD|nr:hypothetical protein Eta_0041 [Serratia phage Eta]AGN89487.1 hypothetical protein Eta_0041 [Serratia phage Eta]
MASISLKVSGLEPMKKLVELLADNYSLLPASIQEAISELYAEERTCWDVDHFMRLGVDSANIKVIVDGLEMSKIIAIYPDESELMRIGDGVHKFATLQVINAATGEPICGVANGDKA